MNLRRVFFCVILTSLTNISFVVAQHTPEQFLQKGIEFMDSGDYDSSIYFLQQGIQKSEKVESEIILDALTLELGNAYKLKGNYSKAFNYYSDLERKFKKEKKFQF